MDWCRHLCRKAHASSWRVQYSDIQIEKELCRTLKSTMHLGRWKGANVVVKSLLAADGKPSEDSMEASPASVAEELLHEIDVLSSIRHPDLVLFLGACLDTTHTIACITEYMPGGDLEAFYVAKRAKHQASVWHPHLKQVLQWATAIARGLLFLHTREVPLIHRDLKPLNLLLTKHLDLKIADLGISRVLAAGKGLQLRSERFAGGMTESAVSAAEVARDHYYNEKVDIYAFALILYFMSSGRQPFHHMGTEFVLDLFVEAGADDRWLAECPRKLRGLLAAAWAADAAKRPGAASMLASLEALESEVAGNPCVSLLYLQGLSCLGTWDGRPWIQEHSRVFGPNDAVEAHE
ncbi:unnamed protein product [Symbiodinium natans]|uniref:Protein kinase domain-containing protein n=1 Tax=Symbiodinium natans TaxID=878477 RepID=A0A812L6U6_9DINO|nr:unnamed protein product [Symbiodinium natans]